MSLSHRSVLRLGGPRRSPNRAVKGEPFTGTLTANDGCASSPSRTCATTRHSCSESLSTITAPEMASNWRVASSSMWPMKLCRSVWPARRSRLPRITAFALASSVTRSSAARSRSPRTSSTRRPRCSAAPITPAAVSIDVGRLADEPQHPRDRSAHFRRLEQQATRPGGGGQEPLAALERLVDCGELLRTRGGFAFDLEQGNGGIHVRRYSQRFERQIGKFSAPGTGSLPAGGLLYLKGERTRRLRGVGARSPSGGLRTHKSSRVVGESRA